MLQQASGSAFGIPSGDARLEMTDPYSFSDPGGPGKAISFLNVHPPNSVNPTERTTIRNFVLGALYD